MKILKHLLIFILFISNTYALDLGPKWKLIRQVEGRYSFAFKSQPEVRLTMNFKEGGGVKKYTQMQLKQLETTKGKTLSVIGITNYKVQKRIIGKSGISMSGSYDSATGIKTNFIEKHFYKDKRDYQLLILSSNSISHDILNKYLLQVIATLGGEK